MIPSKGSALPSLMPKQTISPPSDSVQSTSGFGHQLLQAPPRSCQGLLVFHESKTLLPKSGPQGYLSIPSCHTPKIGKHKRGNSNIFNVIITLVLYNLFGRFGALLALLLSFYYPNSAGTTLPLLHRLLTRFAGSSASRYKEPPPTKKSATHIIPVQF